MVRHFSAYAVIKSGAPYRLVTKGEAARLYDVQIDPQSPAETDHSAQILRNVGFKKGQTHVKGASGRENQVSMRLHYVKNYSSEMAKAVCIPEGIVFIDGP